MTIKRAIKKLTIVTLLLGTLANCAQTGKISKDDSKVLGKDGIRSVEVIRENRKLSQFEINQQLDNAIELINIAARFLPQLNDVRAYLIDQDIERYKKQAREPLEKAENILSGLNRRGYDFAWLKRDIEGVRKEIDEY